jgi:predicted kinase
VSTLPEPNLRPMSSVLSPIPESVTERSSISEDHMPIINEIKSQEYLDFPFLEDDNTIEWIKTNRTVMVMRGLPGSGKSTLVNAVTYLYSPDEPLVCSADHYFLDRNGRYKFDAVQLKNAHESSQSIMKLACTEGKKIIIVDNTNVQRWEMGPYFAAANSAPFTYRVIVAEPKTPWRLDPQELADKNSHDVGLEVLLKKVKQFSVALPVYYAWFFSPTDSRIMLDMSSTLFKRCFVACEEFRDSFKSFSSMLNLASAMNYFSRDMFGSGDRHILHCTAKFCGFQKQGAVKAHAKDYARKRQVQDSLGGVQSLKITGFFFTKDTFGARVELSEDQFHLYDQDEQLSPLSPKRYGKPPKSYPSKEGHKDTLKQSVTLDEEPMNIRDEKKRFYPYPGRGRRAHITLGTAPGVKAMTTGIDLLEVVQAEKDAFEGIDVPKFQTNVDDSKDIIRQYKENMWVVYPEYAISIKTLFTGYY